MWTNFKEKFFSCLDINAQELTELAAALGIGINKAYEIVNDGTINSKRIGRRILIPKLYLVDYIQQTRYNKGV